MSLKYFAILPGMLMGALPGLAALNVMELATPQSAILSALIFNALIIPALIPLALRGVRFRPKSAEDMFRRNLLVYGLGGLIAPFIGIKLIDLCISGFSEGLSMLNMIMSSLRASLVTWLLCGLVYPLALTGLGQSIFPFQANGSLERSASGTVIGSRLIGQQWNGPAWFHGRPSATVPAYNAASSAGSNLGPTSKTLMERIVRDRNALEREQPDLVGRPLPSDLLTTSASGLDPDISPANAALQVERVARARGVPAADISALLDRYITNRSLRIFGERRVNVLTLNLALQRAYPEP